MSWEKTKAAQSHIKKKGVHRLPVMGGRIDIKMKTGNLLAIPFTRVSTDTLHNLRWKEHPIRFPFRLGLQSKLNLLSLHLVTCFHQNIEVDDHLSILPGALP